MGGEVNKIKKAIMRPQQKPCNYVPKFNQNSFPHRAVVYLTGPVRFSRGPGLPHAGPLGVPQGWPLSQSHPTHSSGPTVGSGPA